jgi:hypothetical protein
MMPPIYHLSAYWGNWSRVLHIDIERMEWVELNLTPINGWSRGSIDTVRLEVIRCHGTPRDPADREHFSIPVNIYEGMVDALGSELTSRLLNHDYLSEVTLDQIRQARSNGGGVPLANIKSGTYYQWR